MDKKTEELLTKQSTLLLEDLNNDFNKLSRNNKITLENQTIQIENQTKQIKNQIRQIEDLNKDIELLKEKYIEESNELKNELKNEYIDYILIKVCKLDDIDDKEIVHTIIDNLIKLRYH
jgi:hypothetical protein